MKHNLIQAPATEAKAEAFSGCSHGPQPAARRSANAPPVFVDGVEISETAIAQEAQNHRAATGAEARAAAARALVIRALLLRRAGELNLAPEPARDAQGREETAEEALIRRVLELEAKPVEPSDAECRRVFEASAAQFTSPELFEAAHILFAPEGESTEAWAAAHARATEAIAAIAAGGDFAAWARDCSACPTAAEGGSLGQLQRGDLAEDIERALMQLKPGQIAEAPVRSRHGWHVVHLHNRATAQLLPFETVQTYIRASLRARAWAAASARYVAMLANSVRIEGLTLALGATG